MMATSHQQLSRLCAEAYQQSDFEESNIEVVVKNSLDGGVIFAFRGTDEPAGFARFVSIGALKPETNASIAADVAEVLSSSYGIEASRTYIEFVDVKERWMFGWNGGTF